eukprot:29710-Pelagococcus_subviridis.AAC.2
MRYGSTISYFRTYDSVPAVVAAPHLRRRLGRRDASHRLGQPSNTLFDLVRGQEREADAHVPVARVERVFVPGERDALPRRGLRERSRAHPRRELDPREVPAPRRRRRRERPRTAVAAAGLRLHRTRQRGGAFSVVVSQLRQPIRGVAGEDRLRDDARGERRDAAAADDVAAVRDRGRERGVALEPPEAQPGG